MNFTSNEHPILFAPRPVRLVTAYQNLVNRANSGHDRLRITDANTVDDFKIALIPDSSSDRDQASQRSSPRSGLTTEALEEFLSILRPSFFTPASPVLRTRLQGAAILPNLSQERSLPYRGKGLLEIVPQGDEPSDEIEIARSQQPSRNTLSSHTPDHLHDPRSSSDLDNEAIPFRWYQSSIYLNIASPISRNNTRNPFLRHASNQSPSFTTPLSPAAIPLPLPTPEEMIEIS